MGKFLYSGAEKANHNKRRFLNTYFWRTYDQKEIDYIEEEGGKLKTFEFKFNPKAKIKVPKEFLETYSNSEFKTIHHNTLGFCFVKKIANTHLEDWLF